MVKRDRREYNKRYRKDNHDRLLVSRREYNRDYEFKRNLQEKYGITFADYEKMFKSQGGQCAICGRVQENRRLGVDHDHATGKVRALLCVNCNFAIGYMGDLPEMLERAASYLRAHRAI